MLPCVKPWVDFVWTHTPIFPNHSKSLSSWFSLEVTLHQHQIFDYLAQWHLTLIKNGPLTSRNTWSAPLRPASRRVFCGGTVFRYISTTPLIRYTKIPPPISPGAATLGPAPAPPSSIWRQWSGWGESFFFFFNIHTEWNIYIHNIESWPIWINKPYKEWLENKSAKKTIRGRGKNGKQM